MMPLRLRTQPLCSSLSVWWETPKKHRIFSFSALRLQHCSHLCEQSTHTFCAWGHREGAGLSQQREACPSRVTTREQGDSAYTPLDIMSLWELQSELQVDTPAPERRPRLQMHLSAATIPSSLSGRGSGEIYRARDSDVFLNLCVQSTGEAALKPVSLWLFGRTLCLEWKGHIFSTCP